MSQPDQPIIIAGAGPCGSTLALYLAQRDIPVLLLEAEDSLPRDLRASTFHPPTLEMLDGLGMADDMLDIGLVADRYQYRDRRSGEVAEFDMGLITDETAFPYRLQLEQYEMTHIAARHLQQYPHAEQRFGHRVLGAEQQGDTVRVTVQTPDGEQVLDTPFLIGSTPFAFEAVFDKLSYVNYVADPEEWCVILRTDKLWRVLVPVFPESDADEQRILSDDFVQARLQHLHAKDSPYDIGHRTLYRVHQRVSDTYVRGRIALAGDACHINNPLGGMGMNGGIHDAHNLGGKLVEVIRGGRDPDEALAHYDRQRRELAVAFVQNHTIQNKQLMESTDPDVQVKRQAMLMATAADPVRAKAFIMERAMFDCLRDSLAVA